MSNKAYGKILNFLGFEAVEEVVEVKEPEKKDEVKVAQNTTNNEVEKTKKSQDKVVQLHNKEGQKVTIKKPITVNEDAQAIMDYVKAGSIVVLELSEAKELKEIFHFVAGGIYALNGGMSKVNDKIFVLTPPNTQISNFIDMQNDEKIENIEKNEIVEKKEEVKKGVYF